MSSLPPRAARVFLSSSSPPGPSPPASLAAELHGLCPTIRRRGSGRAACVLVRPHARSERHPESREGERSRDEDSPASIRHHRFGCAMQQSPGTPHSPRRHRTHPAPVASATSHTSEVAPAPVPLSPARSRSAQPDAHVVYAAITPPSSPDGSIVIFSCHTAPVFIIESMMHARCRPVATRAILRRSF
jgi:hypothetical protein